MAQEGDWIDIPESGEIGQTARLRLLADANLPAPLVEEIRRGGRIDIRTAQEMGVANLADPELFRCAKRHGLVLLTMDAGFWSERLYPCQEGGGVVFLNAGPQDADRALEAFVRSYVYFPTARHCCWAATRSAREPRGS